MRIKSRLTITLPEEVLSRVDAFVDGNKIRNRSHAIETLILRSLTPTITRAVILAGGETAGDITSKSASGTTGKNIRKAADKPTGKNIGKIVDKPAGKTPPPLTKISGRFLLAHQLDHLKKFNITQVYMCAGSNNKAIEKIFGDGSQFGVAITYIPEPEMLGTAGAIKLASKYLGNNPFVVMHGDVLTDLNLQDFIEFHLREKTAVTIGVKPRMGEKKYGQAFLHGNKIIKFMETGTTEGISIVNTGIYVFKPEVLERIPGGKKVKLESAIFPALASEGQLGAFIFQGVWSDISGGWGGNF